MKAKKIKSSSFGNTLKLNSLVYRPERQRDLKELPIKEQGSPALAIGNKLSYGDSCLNDYLISSSRLNRFLDFNEKQNTITVEPGVTFNDLLTLNNNIIPAVMPGTLDATIAGGIANDIHGKNQSQQGCLGHHINWLEVALPAGNLHLSRQKNSDLFFATIGGLGLTGFIKKINLTLLKNSHHVEVKKSSFINIEHGIRRLKTNAASYDYSAAWFDPHNQGRGILFNANHTFAKQKRNKIINAKIPATPPFSLINNYSMMLFNSMYYKAMLKKKMKYKQNIIKFNNPLDQVKHWNRLYGKNGLYQFQCVVPFEYCTDFINLVFTIIKKHNASTGLAVMKQFSQSGLGLLSFAKPGITFAIDFPANIKNKNCIEELNQALLDYQGRVYLAKDLLLTKEQFQIMYPDHEKFLEVLKKYELNNVFQSSLSKRLGINT